VAILQRSPLWPSTLATWPEWWPEWGELGQSGNQSAGWPGVRHLAGEEAGDHDRDGRPARDLRRPGRRRAGPGPLLPMAARNLAGDQGEAELLAGDQGEAELLAGDQGEAELLAGDQGEAELLAGRPAIGCRRRLPNWLFPY